MSEFKENISSANLEHMDMRERDQPTLKEADIPKIPKNVDIFDSPLSGSSDVYDNAFRALGFSTDASDGNKQAEAGETVEDNDHSEYLEKGEDGKVLSR